MLHRSIWSYNKTNALIRRPRFVQAVSIVKKQINIFQRKVLDLSIQIRRLTQKVCLETLLERLSLHSLAYSWENRQRAHWGRGVANPREEWWRDTWIGARISGYLAKTLTGADKYIKILTWLRGLSDKIAKCFDSTVSQFLEETWAQRKPNQI